MASSKLKASDLRENVHVAAGHDGFLADESGGLTIKPWTPREVTFYNSTAKHLRFQKWMPTFFGTLGLSGPETAEGPEPSTGPATHSRDTIVVLQNLTCGTNEAWLWDDRAAQEKRDRLDLVLNTTTSRSLGLRIARQKVWKGMAASVYKEYLSADIGKDQKRLIARRVLKKVTEIREVLEGQESRMYSASTLETALKHEEENAKKPPQDEDYDSEDEKVEKVEELKLIDFAHAKWTPGTGHEENASQGVRSTERFLAELVK
ncbi:hypothetical protein HOY80DRAFT_1019255 [Tuber brumale]|nr:hypothetical protein HOY80DRAFT_1019255 [Tuber brumale]